MVQDTFELERIEDEHSTQSQNGPFFFVKRQISNSLMIKAAALLLRSTLERNQLLLLKKIVKTYISNSLLPFVDYDLEGWFSNLDQVTILFASVGVDLSSLKDQEGLARFNNIICIIQKCTLQTNGSMNKLLMDDKGTTLICIWNAHNHHTQESAARAISAAKQFKKQLGKMGVSISMGLATGKVFAGIVGASGGRREYSILGDSANLSARLMQAAGKSKTRKIIIDQKTMTLASSRVNCMFHDDLTVKGKSVAIPSYFPEDKFDDFEAIFEEKYKMPQQLNLLAEALKHTTSDICIHTFPFDQNTCDKLVLQLGESIMCTDKFNSVVFKGRLKASEKFQKVILNSVRDEEPIVVVISGGVGVGKSQFLKQNLDSLSTKEETANFFLNYFSIETHQYFERGGSLVNLYSHLLAAVRSKTSNYRDSEEDVVRNIVENHFGPDNLDYQALEKMTDFVESMSLWRIPDIKYATTRFTKNLEVFELACLVFEALLAFYIDLIWKGSKSKPFILAIDWANLLNEMEAKVLKHVVEKLKMVLVLIYTTDFTEKPATISLSKFTTFFQSEIANFEHLVLKPLDSSDALTLCNKFTSLSFNVDIPIDVEVADYIADKCMGKPLHILSMLTEMSEKGFLEVQSQVLTVSETFKEKAGLSFGEHYIVAPPSLIREKIYLFDKLKPLDFMILNMASVFGEVFDDQILERINFFPQINGKILNQRLVELCKQGIIECLGPQLKFKVYRFVDPAFRFVLYETMLFQQRRAIHNQYKEYLKSNPTPEYLFVGLDKSIRKAVSENILYYHFTASSPPTEVSKIENMTQSSRQLYIEVVKALVVHAVRLAEQNNPGDGGKIIAQTFKKVSKDVDKLPVTRYYVITKETFSYYETEDHYRFSADLFIMRFFHSHISEVSLFKSTHDKEVPYQVAIYINKGIKGTKAVKQQLLKLGFTNFKNAMKLKYALEYLKLIHLHSTLSKEFDALNITGYSGHQDIDMAEKINNLLSNSETGKEDYIDEEQTMSGIKESEERRARTTQLLMEELKAFYNKLLLKKQ